MRHANFYKIVTKKIILFWVLCTWGMGGQAWAYDSRGPALAYDSYEKQFLMVWEQGDAQQGSQIMGKLLNEDGSDKTSAELRLSPDRPQQGCFYQGFDEDNGAITTPKHCNNNLNPAVAYNDGHYLLVWEVQGRADFPASEADKKFSSIFARLIDAKTLTPLPGWEEGILISKIYLASTHAEECQSGKFACQDSDIQAWSRAIHPHVAPRLQGGGFVVTWETNKDFIGCANPSYRQGSSVYARYIDPDFSMEAKDNPQPFPVFKDDSTLGDYCVSLLNVDKANEPRIAYNGESDDFVVVYELARSGGGRTAVGAKQIIFEGQEAMVRGSMMGGLLAFFENSSLKDPDVLSDGNHYFMVASDGLRIFIKRFMAASIEASSPVPLDLPEGPKMAPRIASHRSSEENSSPSGGKNPLLLAYENAEDVFAALVDPDSVQVLQDQGRINEAEFSKNQDPEALSNGEDFLVVASGIQNQEEQLWVKRLMGQVDLPPRNSAPSQPVLLTPEQSAEGSPTRVYLSWAESSDPENNALTYNVYFGANQLPDQPQWSGLTKTYAVVGPETSDETGIILAPNTTYQWKVEAQDLYGNRSSGEVRSFHTDDSLVGWWRFESDPEGPACVGANNGETICDDSSQANHGELNGNVSWILPELSSLLGGALEFSGAGAVVVADDPSLNMSEAFTVLIGLKVTSLAPGNRFINKLDLLPPLNGYNLDIDENTDQVRLEVCHGDLGCQDIHSDTFVTMGSTYRVTGTLNAAMQLAVYVDGALENTQNIPFFSGLTTEPLRMGNWGSSFAEGQIDEVMVLNRAWSSEEVQNDHKSAWPEGRN